MRKKLSCFVENNNGKVFNRLLKHLNSIATEFLESDRVVPFILQFSVLLVFTYHNLLGLEGTTWDHLLIESQNNDPTSLLQAVT